jgi:hypothetical protein
MGTARFAGAVDCQATSESGSTFPSGGSPCPWVPTGFLHGTVLEFQVTGRLLSPSPSVDEGYALSRLMKAFAAPSRIHIRIELTTSSRCTFSLERD